MQLNYFVEWLFLSNVILAFLTLVGVQFLLLALVFFYGSVKQLDRRPAERDMPNPAYSNLSNRSAQSSGR